MTPRRLSLRSVITSSPALNDLPAMVSSVSSRMPSALRIAHHLAVAWKDYIGRAKPFGTEKKP